MAKEGNLRPLCAPQGFLALKKGDQTKEGDLVYSNYHGEFIPLSEWHLKHMPLVEGYDFVIREVPKDAN